MFNYQRLKKKYEKLYNKTLDKNKEILLESFVEYYGEEFRDVITSKFNEIIFIYYIDWEAFSKVSKESSFNEENTGKFKDLKNFLKYRKNTSDSFNDRLIGTSNKKLLKEELIDDYLVVKRLIESLNDRNPKYYSIFRGNQMYRLICLPILIHTETSVIHEINHALTSSSLILDEIQHRLITKVGFQVDDKDVNINELINERASREIFEIFKRRGGDLSTLHLDNFKCDYTENLYLIDEFYNKFKEIIKEAYITLNKNNLVQRVGKENYKELVNMINNYINDLDIYGKNKEKTKKVREELVQKMQERVINAEELTKEDLEGFYKQLEQEGKIVRILNELPENNEEEKKNFHF